MSLLPFSYAFPVVLPPQKSMTLGFGSMTMIDAASPSRDLITLVHGLPDTIKVYVKIDRITISEPYLNNFEYFNLFVNFFRSSFPHLKMDGIAQIITTYLFSDPSVSFHLIGSDLKPFCTSHLILEPFRNHKERKAKTFENIETSFSFDQKGNECRNYGPTNIGFMISSNHLTLEICDIVAGISL